jgi:acetolactate synthase-1/2/3 large subunit
MGVDHFFLVTGGDNSLWIAFEKLGIRQCLARSEASAVYMADAYARLTHKPTFVYGQYGPGAANLVGSMAECLWSNSPVIAMPTSMRRQHRHRYEYQELEQLHLFNAVTKWQGEPQIPAQVPHTLRAAAIKALAGVPGPVYLGIPSDILEQEVPDYTPPTEVCALETPLYRSGASEAQLLQAVELLQQAERPVILAGNGIHLSGAYEGLRRVAEALHVPVVTSLAGKGSIAETHELAVGTVGRYSRNYANDLVKKADLVLAIGSRLGGLVTDSYRLIAADVKVIHVDIDGAVVGLNFPIELGVAADARLFLDGLADLLERNPVAVSAARTATLDKLAEDRRAWNVRRVNATKRDGTDGREMRPEAVLDVLSTMAPDDTVVLADTGYAAAWAGALFELPTAGQNFLRADGSLGWAFPASLGAKLARPDQPVLCVTGDGGFGYHVGEIETALRLNLPVVVVVLNNRALAFEVHVQELIYKKVVDAVDDFVDVDYAAIARAFGARGERVRTVEELKSALATAFDGSGPMIIDAIIDREAAGPVTRYDAIRAREL